MSGGVVLDPFAWRPARVADRWPETHRATTLRLALDRWPGHSAGQRVDVRLTADDGYQATRSYSIASAPSAGGLDLTVERLDDGEVSPWLVDIAAPGDELEVRGPIGGWFTWRPGGPDPLVLVGGGSGLVPLMAMAREAVHSAPEVDVRLLVSTRTRADLLFAAELHGLSAGGGVQLVHTVTRETPASATWDGRVGRIDPAATADLLAGAAPVQAAYVCGPTGFVDRAAGLLQAAGVPPGGIRTERFGPSS